MLAALKALVGRGVALVAPHLPRILVVAVVAAGVLYGMYSEGERHQRDVEAAAAYTAKRDTIIERIRVTDTLIRHDTVRVAASITKATDARRKVAAADSALETAVDPTGATSAETEVPLALALPPVEACKSALAADDSVYVAMTQLLADKDTAIAEESARAQLAEQRLEVASHRPLFGFKSGVVAGVGVALLFVWVF